MSRAEVVVVVLNWNGWRDTLACLDSLKQLDYPDAKVLVVDNGSTDGSVEHIRQAMPDVALLQTGVNLGFGGGCNAGIRQALGQGADYVWLVNSDATVAPGALSALVMLAQRNPALGSVGSVVHELDEPEKIQLWGGGRVNLWTGRSRHLLTGQTPDFISGASVLLRGAALRQAGLFDEQEFFMYWEDTDLALRFRQAGWQLAVAPDSRLLHKQSASLGRNSPQLDYYFIQSGVRFFKRHAPFPLLPISFMLSRMLLKRLATGQFARVRAVLKGFLSA
ncbi:MAG: glycosyltransferase family 2 protein [Polaromonas sp.]